VHWTWHKCAKPLASELNLNPKPKLKLWSWTQKFGNIWKT